MSKFYISLTLPKMKTGDMETPQLSRIALLNSLFFGALWITVTKGVSSRHDLGLKIISMVWFSRENALAAGIKSKNCSHIIFLLCNRFLHCHSRNLLYMRWKCMTSVNKPEMKLRFNKWFQFHGKISPSEKYYSEAKWITF